MKKLWCNLKEWKNEVIGILLAVALFLCTPSILRLVDPTAGGYDAGVLHIIAFAIVSVLVFSFLSSVGVKVNFPPMFNYLQCEFANDFKSLTPWQKVKISVFVFFSFLLAFVLMGRVL